MSNIAGLVNHEVLSFQTLLVLIFDGTCGFQTISTYVRLMTLALKLHPKIFMCMYYFSILYVTNVEIELVPNLTLILYKYNNCIKHSDRRVIKEISAYSSLITTRHRRFSEYNISSSSLIWIRQFVYLVK